MQDPKSTDVLPSDASSQKCGWIHVRGIHIHDASVGILPHEYKARQPLEIDLGLWASMAKAAASDSIEDAIDYAQVTERVSVLVRANHYALLERLCDLLCATLLKEFQPQGIWVEIRKPHALQNGCVAIKMAQGVLPPH